MLYASMTHCSSLIDASELARDERQREVDDRHVEPGRERAEAEHDERNPTRP